MKNKVKKIVIKVGSSLFCRGSGGLNRAVFTTIVAQVAALIKDGFEPIIVSSGAIAMGMHTLAIKDRPKELHLLQATAAIGQNELMNAYRTLFSKKGIRVAQILLTWEDFRDRARYLNAKNTLCTLLELGAVPVINENDTVSTEEIKFGDNDRLSALVATLVGADLLIILSDVDGLLEKDMRTVIPLVKCITPEIKALACPTSTKTCVGGMVTKIDAAGIATASGIPCVIANGRAKGVIAALARQPGCQGTLFMPRKGLAERDSWIAFASKPRGKITVDQRSRKALRLRKSLRAAGVTAILGHFELGDVVSILDEDHAEFARGTASLDSARLAKIIGLHREQEVVHRNNIVLFSHE